MRIYLGKEKENQQGTGPGGKKEEEEEEEARGKILQIVNIGIEKSK